MLTEEQLKNDKEKLRYDLVPMDALEALTRIYTFGAKKYEAHSWERGMKVSRIFAALLRHLFAWWRGEDKDPESGELHLAHVSWNAFALLTYALRNMHECDDRTNKHVPTEGK